MALNGNYPPDWTTISRRVRAEARERCELCGCVNGSALASGAKVVLTVHHIGAPLWCPGRPGDPHDKADCRGENLVALCQSCHLDAERQIRKLGVQGYQGTALFDALTRTARARHRNSISLDGALVALPRQHTTLLLAYDVLSGMLLLSATSLGRAEQSSGAVSLASLLTALGVSDQALKAIVAKRQRDAHAKGGS